MFLSLTTTHCPATDLGYLLLKHPDKVHEKQLAFGTAHLFYPEAGEGRCTAALVVDVDPVGLVRGRRGRDRLFDHYVTDRPFVASSFLSVAIARLLGTAMSGRSKGRQELADTPIPLEAVIAPLPCRGGPEILERLFAPLGYDVEAGPHPLDPDRPDWGPSAYVTARISGQVRLAELLTHLFVLIPVLDNQKHYWVGPDEVDKLLAKGTGWLETHPQQTMIAKRYLKHRSGLARATLNALAEQVEPAEADMLEAQDEAEATLEKPIRLHETRLDTVTRVLLEAGAKTVADLGCGEGKLLRRLLKEKQFTRILGIEVSAASLERASRRLKLDHMPLRQRERIDLVQGALTYRDVRLEGLDAAAAVEVIEHLEPDRLPAFEQAIFAAARPKTVIVTTPNREFNATFEDFEPGKLRHPDHRFEWTRAEFEAWAKDVAKRRGYAVRIDSIGEAHEDYGPPTQMGVFRR